MSWSLSLQADMETDVSAAIDAALKAAPAAREHAGPQAAAAREAVLALLTAVARDTDRVLISMSGHYNEDKKPVPGWADCQISITVSQMPKAPSA